jgi:hypothetical protein
MDGTVLKFVNFIDGSTWDGPRVATNQDMLDHPDALAKAERPLQPMPDAVATELIKGAPPPFVAPEDELPKPKLKVK